MVVENDFTPALGFRWLTPLYDIAIAVLTRERKWRKLLLRQITPASGERILDVGCGTGSLAILLKRQAPDAVVIGLDPDAEILKRASNKAAAQGVNVEWCYGFLTDEVTEKLRPVNKIASSLVLHQTSLQQKQQILNRSYEVLSPGGELHIADYGLQESRLMRFLFRMTVQRLDGVEDTQPNADGVLPSLISKAGFTDISLEDIVPTLTGSITLYTARKRFL